MCRPNWAEATAQQRERNCDGPMLLGSNPDDHDPNKLSPDAWYTPVATNQCFDVIDARGELNAAVHLLSLGLRS